MKYSFIICLKFSGNFFFHCRLFVLNEGSRKVTEVIKLRDIQCIERTQQRSSFFSQVPALKVTSRSKAIILHWPLIGPRRFTSVTPVYRETLFVYLFVHCRRWLQTSVHTITYGQPKMVRLPPNKGTNTSSQMWPLYLTLAMSRSTTGIWFAIFYDKKICLPQSKNECNDWILWWFLPSLLSLYHRVLFFCHFMFFLWIKNKLTPYFRHH